METLDLHGTRHARAEERVRFFLNFVELPCQVITGNSKQMKSIVIRVVDEYEWTYHEKDTYNCGALIISERAR